MEVKILDSIIHGELKPWKIDTNNTRRFTEFVKASKATTPNTTADLLSQLSKLLIDYPILQNLIKNESINSSSLLPLPFNVTLPKYKNGATHFYYSLVTSETLRFYNSFLLQSAKWTELVDIRYQVGGTLTNIRVLAKQATMELNDRGFVNAPNAQSDLTHFALYYLKHRLIQLYFSIQEYFKLNLEHSISLEDFYLLDLEDPIMNMVELKPIDCPDEKDINTTNPPFFQLQTQIETFNEENIEIEKIEIDLRSLIIDKLQIHSSAEYKKIIPSHIQEKISTSVEREQKKNPALVRSKNLAPEYLLQFFDLQDLLAVFTSKNNWEVVQEIFATKEILAMQFNDLSGLRNPMRHSREVDKISLLRGKAAILWFRQQLQMK